MAGIYGGKGLAGNGWREHMEGKSWRGNIDGKRCAIFFLCLRWKMVASFENKVLALLVSEIAIKNMLLFVLALLVCACCTCWTTFDN